jgi:hypothetical protein
MRLSTRIPLLLFLGGVFSTCSTARASILTFPSVVPYTGTTSQVSVTFRDGADALSAGTVEVTIAVVANPNIGDIRGMFFNVSNNSLLSGLSITGTHVTQTVFNAGAVNNLGGGSNSNPEGPFDIGVEIGTPGIGFDDIQLTTFVIDHDTLSLSNSDFTTETDPITGGGPNQLLFAVRMTSVGLLGGDRNGSSKLGNGTPTPVPDPDPPTHTPEPASLAIWTLGAATAAFIARRKRKPATA